MAAASGKHKDTYRATAVFLVLTGLLYLIDKWVGFGHLGLPWVMQKDTMLLYAAIIFLWFKSDKSVGLDDFKQDVLSFGASIEVLEPEHVRDEIGKTVRELNSIYNG